MTAGCRFRINLLKTWRSGQKSQTVTPAGRRLRIDVLGGRCPGRF
jgi:hypothetical protein